MTFPFARSALIRERPEAGPRFHRPAVVEPIDDSPPSISDGRTSTSGGFGAGGGEDVSSNLCDLSGAVTTGS